MQSAFVRSVSGSSDRWLRDEEEGRLEAGDLGAAVAPAP